MYADRDEAGRALGRELRGYAGRGDVVVLGLPRGGVPVAAWVAAALRAPLDVLLVRKLGLPGNAELAMGAIAAVGNTVEVIRNDQVLVRAGVSADSFDRVYRAEVAELRRRERTYRAGRPALSVRDRVVIVVDDGLATGSTMRAALSAARRQEPIRLVAAVPVAPAETCGALSQEFDEVVCPWMPDPFFAVGVAYDDFTPTSDDDVRRLMSALAELARLRSEPLPRGPGDLDAAAYQNQPGNGADGHSVR